MVHYNDVDEIKRANFDIGERWFGPETIKLFAVRTLPTVYAGRFFVTSEKSPYRNCDHCEPRYYYVLMALSSGKIERVNHTAYRTRREAVKVAKELAKRYEAEILKGEVG